MAEAFRWGEAIMLSSELNLLKGASLPRRAELLSLHSAGPGGGRRGGPGRVPYTNICRRVHLGLSMAVDKDGFPFCASGFGALLSRKLGTVCSVLIPSSCSFAPARIFPSLRLRAWHTACPATGGPATNPRTQSACQGRYQSGEDKNQKKETIAWQGRRGTEGGAMTDT